MFLPLAQIERFGTDSLFQNNTSNIWPVLVIIGVVVLLVMVPGIIRRVRGEKGASGGSGGGGSFSSFRFNLAAMNVGLNGKDRKFLARYAKMFNIADPAAVMREGPALDTFFGRIYDKLRTQKNDGVNIDNAESQLLHLREYFSRIVPPLKSTQDMHRGMQLVLMRGKEAYRSNVLIQEQTGLVIEEFTNFNGTELPIEAGTSLALRIYDKHQNAYNLHTRVTSKKTGMKGVKQLVLAHTNNIKRIMSRASRRKTLDLNCVIFRTTVSSKSSSRHTKVIVDPQGISAQINDISSGGISLRTSAEFAAGQVIKVSFNTKRGAITIFGKIVGIDGSGYGATVHVRVLKIPRKHLNTIMAYIYDLDKVI